VKFWIKAQVQCEAKEVLGFDCGEKKDIEILVRTQHKDGKVDPLTLFSSMMGILDLEHSQWEQEGWVAHSQDHKPPRFFCPMHAEAGVAMLKYTGDKDE
jgi:hypothetical protein